MRKRLIPELTLLVIAAVSAGAQGAPNVNQTATRSTCVNIVALSGAKVDCSNLTPSQKRAIEQIPSILKTALTNQEYLEAIKAKLEEMSQTGTTVVVQSGGVASVGQQGGITAGVVNVNQPTIPRFLGVVEVTIDGLGHPYPDKDRDGHPLTYAKFYADSAWDNSTILVACDRPCKPYDANTFTANITMGGTVTTFDYPTVKNIAGFELTGMLHPMQANKYYVVGVSSLDESPVKIVDVGPFRGTLPPH